MKKKTNINNAFICCCCCCVWLVYRILLLFIFMSYHTRLFKFILPLLLYIRLTSTPPISLFLITLSPLFISFSSFSLSPPYTPPTPSLQQIDINTPISLPDGLRLIHVAARHCQSHLVQELIALGADVNVLDREGWIQSNMIIYLHA